MAFNTKLDNCLYACGWHDEKIRHFGVFPEEVRWAFNTLGVWSNIIGVITTSYYITLCI